jgi:hypothetical protein
VAAWSEVNHQQAFSRVVTFEHLHSNELLTEGLKHLGADPAWDQTLQMAGTVLEKPDPLK